MNIEMLWWLFLVIPTYFIWTLIHELAHYFMAKYLVNAKLVYIKTWPHIDPVAGFRWGSVRYSSRLPTELEQTWIYIAPRIPDLLALIMLSFVICLDSHLFIAWSIFWGGGVVDLINGSMGISEYSDLKRAFKDTTVRWVARISGLTSSLIVIVAWILTFLYKFDILTINLLP